MTRSVLISLALCATIAAAAERPNIIYLMTDDQRWDAMSCAGNKILKTPEMDKLAARGVRFTNAFVTTAICAVSRANVLTGQHARRHGIHDFPTPLSPRAMAQTYPALLKKSGYYVGFIGKWGVGADLKNTIRQSQVFDFWAGESQQSNFWHERTCKSVTYDGVSDRENGICDCPADKRGHKGPAVRVGKHGQKDPVHLSTYIIPKKITQFLDARTPEKPFCLSISFKAPHGPWSDFDKQFSKLFVDTTFQLPKTATLEEADKQPAFLRQSLESDRGRTFCENPDKAFQSLYRQYYRLIVGVEMCLGKLRQELEKRGLDKNTVIIFTSDHGHFMGEHGFFGKWLPHEESMRIPLIIVDPRLPAAHRGTTNVEMALSIDFAPTMLEFADIPVPKRMQGKSLVRSLTNPEARLRDAWFYEHAYDHRGRIAASEATRTRDWKYVRYTGQKPVYEQLFHLSKDPLETTDLVRNPAYEAKLAELRSLHARLVEEAR